MATLRGERVDRPAVSFYELNGLDQDPGNPDPFNIYSHPSWHPLLELTRQRTDRIVMRRVPFTPDFPDPVSSLSTTETVTRGGTRFTTQTLPIGGRTLTSRRRRDRDVNTLWTEEHLLKDENDLRAFLQLPAASLNGTVETAGVLQAEADLGEAGIVMIDTPDPLCLAASLFEMGEYTVIALTEQALFHQLLEHFAAPLQAKTEAVAKALPGRLWRIYGPEYASPPYLPRYLFTEYVCRYVTPMVRAIQRHGGFVRIHCHGNLKKILDDIVSMGPDAIDPIEPPPQGDVELRYVRENYGKDLVLFGNLEVSDIENLPTPQFAEHVRRALAEGTSGDGRGFVLMPSACPYGREISSLTLRNYETILELAGA
jgi:hypothetical protein